jgi:hypothetical protein
MKLPILILMVCSIGFVLIGGCTTITSPPPATPAMDQPITPTVQATPFVGSTLPVSYTDTLCGELVYCGYAPAGFETQPITSSRCDQLYTLRMNNDQKVLQCLKNQPESGSNNSGERSQCMQGIGTAEDCAGYGILIDRDSGSGATGKDGTGSESSIRQTKDDGYIVIGSINEVSSGYSTEDIRVVKLNPAGDIQWQKVLGGDGFDAGRSIEPTTDGGYILTGVTDSDNTGDVGPNHGRSDVWVVKLNPAGDIQWQKVLGGDGFDAGRSIEHTPGGEYILTGVTDSDNTGDVGPNHGESDIWVVKLNPAGIIQWQKVLGGYGFESGRSIVQTTDGGYILTGPTDSDNTGDVGPNHGESDIWAVKLNAAGDIQWQKVLGGEGFESGRGTDQATDGGYILTGPTDSDNTGDVGPNHGESDIWVVKLNPAGIIQWQKVLGGDGFDAGRSIEHTTGGGYILTGLTDSDNTGDVGPNPGGSAIWVVKLNPAGDIQWQKVLGGAR